MDANATKIKEALDTYSASLGFFISGTVVVSLLGVGLVLLSLAMLSSNLFAIITGTFAPWFPTGIRSGIGGYYEYGDLKDAAYFLIAIGPFILYTIRSNIKNVFSLIFFHIKGGRLFLSNTELETAVQMILDLPIKMAVWREKYPGNTSKKILTILQLIGVVKLKYGQINWNYLWFRDESQGSIPGISS